MVEAHKPFDQYLSTHLSQVTDPYRFRERAKQHLWYNFGKLVPTDRQAQILEIGPGFGELLELLVRDRGYTNVCAVDLSAEVAEFCNARVPGTTQVVADTAAFLQEHAGRFDCIFMMHVLEHIPKAEIIPLLATLRQALRPGGRLVLEVPNMANPLIGLNFRYADFTHEVGFTELSLHHVLQHAGFTHIRPFAPRMLRDRPARLLQEAARHVVNWGVTVLYRAYASKRPQIISPTLCAVAVKAGQ